MHLKKCFEGIAKLHFDDELEVLEMCSVSDEVIPLVKPISTIKARGQVDKWLAELEIQMRLSLRQQIDNALKVGLRRNYSILSQLHIINLISKSNVSR